MPTKNVYFTDDDFAWIAYYALEHKSDITEVVKLVIQRGIEALKEKKELKNADK